MFLVVIMLVVKISVSVYLVFLVVLILLVMISVCVFQCVSSFSNACSKDISICNVFLIL